MEACRVAASMFCCDRPGADLCKAFATFQALGLKRTGTFDVQSCSATASHGPLFRLVNQFETIRYLISSQRLRANMTLSYQGSVNYLGCPVLGRQRSELQQVLRIRSSRRPRALSGVRNHRIIKRMRSSAKSTQGTYHVADVAQNAQNFRCARCDRCTRCRRRCD